MKSYEFEIEIKFDQILDAKNEKEAIKQLKQTFLDEYNLDLTDEEIKSIKLRGNR